MAKPRSLTELRRLGAQAANAARTPKQRSALARKAARARWQVKPTVATDQAHADDIKFHRKAGRPNR